MPSLGWAQANLKKDDRLVVMTSYPQEVISRVLDAYAAVRPQVRVDVVWHSGDDARDYLLGAGKDQVDVYWSPSVRTFHELKHHGAFRKLNVDRSQLPGKIGKQIISDPDGYFEASEIAGYGLVLNPAYLKDKSLPAPEQWKDLAEPRYFGHLAFPQPSRIGFAPTIVELILQSHGWKDGWALLAEIAANATLQSGRGDTALDLVKSGQKGVGVSIDFFPAQAIARGAPLQFVYPDDNAFEPANIALSAHSPHPQAAEDFTAFILSEDGQGLLIDPDLRRLSIRPSVYTKAPKDYYNPWQKSALDRLTFDDAIFVKRRDLDNALYDRFIVEGRDQTQPLWAEIRRLQTLSILNGKAKAEVSAALAALTSPPITEDEANGLAAAFYGRRRDGGDSTPQSLEAEQSWTQVVKTSRLTAERHIAVAQAELGRP
jgi:ABC-type Fe3+ transport system substrate-binding protein